MTQTIDPKLPASLPFQKTHTLLYVEDDEDVRLQTCQILKRWVGTLVTAVDGAEGLKAFQETHPQLIVTDVWMPVMDGLAMAKEIRALDPAVPIIITTAFESTDFMMKSIEVGANK